VQTVVTDQTSRGYVPDVAVVAAGVPIRWEITSVSNLTCAAYMRGITDPAWKVDLKTGANVVELPALAPGPWDFTCAMGMYRGTIYAIEQPSS
jgi:plastocyanin domain-containing protein